jgi:hypothetical protein
MITSYPLRSTLVELEKFNWSYSPEGENQLSYFFPLTFTTLKWTNNYRNQWQIKFFYFGLTQQIKL